MHMYLVNAYVLGGSIWSIYIQCIFDCICRLFDRARVVIGSLNTYERDVRTGQWSRVRQPPPCPSKQPRPQPQSSLLVHQHQHHGDIAAMNSVLHLQQHREHDLYPGPSISASPMHNTPGVGASTDTSRRTSGGLLSMYETNSARGYAADKADQIAKVNECREHFTYIRTAIKSASSTFNVGQRLPLSVYKPDQKCSSDSSDTSTLVVLNTTRPTTTTISAYHPWVFEHQII